MSELSDTESVHSRSCLRERFGSKDNKSRSNSPSIEDPSPSVLSLNPTTSKPTPKNHWKSLKVQKGKVAKASIPITYKRVARDLEYIQANSLRTSFHTRQYSDILRNQLIKAHIHSLLEIALKFEQYRQKYPHNKDPTWYLEKVAEDLFVFTDELQGISNLSEADRRVTAIDFEELVQPSNIGPFVGFSDPRLTIHKFQNRAFGNLNTRIS